MCGIVGMTMKDSTTIPYKYNKIFKDLLFLSQLRGMHSTGVMTIDNKGEPKIYKTAVNASTLLQNNPPKFKELIRDGKCFMIGHTRHATIGKVNRQNAHPFQHGNITGLHNGTIRGHFANKDKFDTDSETLIYNVNELGSIDKAIREMYTYNCAFACAIHDKKESTLTFLRNNDRPLWCGIVKNGHILYASEKNMLEFVGEKHDLEYKDLFPLKTLTEHQFHIDIEKGKHNFANKERDWKTKTYTRNYNNAYSSYHHQPRLPISNRPTLPPNNDNSKKEPDPYEEFNYLGTTNYSKVYKKNQQSIEEYERKQIELETTFNDSFDMEMVDVTEYDEYSSRDMDYEDLESLRHSKSIPHKQKLMLIYDFLITQAQSPLCLIVDGEVITKNKITKLLDNGCYCCQSQDWREGMNKIFWFDDENYICEHCFQVNTVQELVLEEYEL